MSDLPLGSLSKEEEERLEQFHRRRQLNERMVGLLDQAKQAHDLKMGEVTTVRRNRNIRDHSRLLCTCRRCDAFNLGYNPA